MQQKITKLWKAPVYTGEVENEKYNKRDFKIMFFSFFECGRYLDG